MIRFSASIVSVLAISVEIALALPAAAENVLRWASVGGALTFDPHSVDEVPTIAQNRLVYERLVGYDSDLTQVPQLAVSWRPIDPLTWEFKLREGVRFHDGTPFSAEDVEFSLERARTDPAQKGAYLASVTDVRVVDANTVHIVTQDPSQLAESLQDIEIMSKAWAERHGVTRAADIWTGEETYASRHANGTGPFILEEFQPNGPLVMRRNPDWWGYERYPVNIDRIEYTPIADPEQRLAAVLEDKIDLLTDPPFDTLDRLRTAPGWKLEQATELRTIFLGLDQAAAELRSSNVKGANPFKDKRVRQAMYQSIGIEAIRRDVMRGLSLPAGMLVAPGVTGFSEELSRRLPYDPNEAKRLLTEAGYPDGFRVTLDCPNNRYINDEAICHAVADQLGEIGIDAAVDAQPKARHFQKIFDRHTDFWLLGWAEFDSQNIFQSVYTQDSRWNATGYVNPQLEELIEQIEHATITYARDALIEDVWKIVLGDIVYIPLHYQIIVWAMHDNLKLPIFPMNRPQFQEARFQ